MSTTQTATIKDFRNNLANYANLVAVKGQSVIVTKFGKPVGKFIPISEDKSLSKKELAEKKAKRNESLDKLIEAWDEESTVEEAVQWVNDLRDRQSPWNDTY